MWESKLDTSDTIFALTSGALPCAVAVVRLSGPKAFEIAGALSQEKLARERGMSLRKLFHKDGRLIDESLILSFVSPNSFTGEDCVELQCHGSVPVVSEVEKALLSLGGRPAEKGEFSFRAHLNGKLSLEDLERLGDVYQARESRDLDRVYSRRDESLQKEVDRLRQKLIQLQGILDTAVDFADEYSGVVPQAFPPLEEAIHECSVITQRYSRFREGSTLPRLVLAGRPNAGKSSLFNALLCRYRAIVHQEPGTTRDVIEEDLQLGGRRWKVVDTAGVRTASDSRETEGISMGEDFLGASQFWLLLVDGTEGLLPEDERLLEAYSGTPHLVIWNKVDLPGWTAPPEGSVPLSTLDGDSVEALWGRLQRELAQVVGEEGPLPTAVQSRRLEEVKDDLEGLKVSLEREVPPEYLGEDCRRALGRLSGIIGEVNREEVLDRVFSDFCIGK